MEDIIFKLKSVKKILRTIFHMFINSVNFLCRSGKHINPHTKPHNACQQTETKAYHPNSFRKHVGDWESAASSILNDNCLVCVSWGLVASKSLRKISTVRRVSWWLWKWMVLHIAREYRTSTDVVNGICWWKVYVCRVLNARVNGLSNRTF